MDQNTAPSILDIEERQFRIDELKLKVPRRMSLKNGRSNHCSAANFFRIAASSPNDKAFL
jgi:hypothetical protein